MKKAMFGLLCAAFMWSCSGGSNYTITIVVPDGVDGVRLTHSEMGLPDVIQLEFDAATNTYTGKGRIDEPEMAMIVDGDDQMLAAICIEEGDIRAEFDDEAAEFVVSGTPSNDAVTRYRPQLLALVEEWEQSPSHTEEEQEAFFERFYDKVNEVVDLNNDNLYGASLFASSAVPVMEPEEIIERIEKFPKHLQNNKILAPVKEYAQAALKTSVGAHFTDIVAPDADGVEVKLSDVVGEGRWVLVDFWATWCGPCRGELPYLKAAYEKYADKGFEIYGVSLDSNHNAWKEFVPANAMTWINVIDVSTDGEKGNPAAEAYGIQSIPSNFLISPEGVIIARNLRGEGVEEALAEIFE